MQPFFAQLQAVKSGTRNNTSTVFQVVNEGEFALDRPFLHHAVNSSIWFEQGVKLTICVVWWVVTYVDTTGGLFFLFVFRGGTRFLFEVLYCVYGVFWSIVGNEAIATAGISVHSDSGSFDGVFTITREH